MAFRLGEFHIFDTDLLSECIRQKPEAIAFFKGIPQEKRRTTVINEIELLEGRFQQIQTADSVERLVAAQLRLDQTRTFLAALPAIHAIDDEAARFYFRLIRQRGLKKIGRRDLLIAAMAVRHSSVLVTGNVRHFAVIPGLRLIDWREV